MPPKKTRAQSSSSQPLPTATRAPGRKRRRVSDASTVSDLPATSQASVPEPATKKKKGRPAAASQEQETIEEEPEPEQQEDELNRNYLAFQHGGDATVETEPPGITSNPPRESKHVTFDSGASDSETVTLNLTPYPRKMTIKRRVTMSPGVATTKRIRTTIGRSSLPASFLTDAEKREPAHIIKELQFAPLRSVLDERIRRRLRRNRLSEEQNEIEQHAKRDSRTEAELERLTAEALEKERRIEELMYELEVQRQAAIDITDAQDEERIRELEEELANSKRELAAHLAEHRLERHIDIVPDDEMMVLDAEEELQYPQPYTTHLHDKTLATFGDANTIAREYMAGRASMGLVKLTAEWDVERRKFEDAILALSKEAQEAKAELQILQIELEGLGFGDGSLDHKSILLSIRRSFSEIREAFESILPDTLPENATTQDAIAILIANVSEFTERLRLQEEDLVTKDTVIADLGNQVQGLLDHLTEAEIRKNDLEKQWRKLDEQNEQKAREIEYLEERIQEYKVIEMKLRNELRDKLEEVKILGEDHAQSLRNLEKLQLSLENYRVEETRLTELIARMEDEHRATIVKMNKEREETVRELEDRFDAEARLRVEAEELSVARQTEISRLEALHDTIVRERNNLSEELETVRAERDIEMESRKNAEIDLNEKAEEITGLEERVDRLEEELEKVDNELGELRSMNESERQQRQAAENDLDDRNAEIEELKKKLQAQGMEANELRLKLHQAQQESAEEIKRLEAIASERDEQYQTDMAAEIERRERADELAQLRATTILELETRLEQVQLQMRNDIMERDERIEALEADIAERDVEIENLRLNLRSLENELDLERGNHQDRVNELDSKINSLQDMMGELESKIRLFQEQEIRMTELHNSEVEDRNAEIASLHATITNLEMQVAELTREKSSLERRVEEEAEAMLDMQGQKDDEIDHLKRILAEKQAKILDVEAKVVEQDQSWQDVAHEKDLEIEMQKAMVEEQEETITTQKSELLTMKKRFMEYIHRTNTALTNLQAFVRRAKENVDEEAEIELANGDELFAELEAMDVDALVKTTSSITKKTTASSSSAVGIAKKGRGRKSKRVEDSGIGLEGEVEEGLAI
ncbi:MAG: hypothetical protein FE78DRAFT_101678 [Acidomyces sp. 'richmondensis']|nr:MAG: hypothetical protein FE78DRAFT_101678 [Acidomyces sp. 'richmondensis']